MNRAALHVEEDGHTYTDPDNDTILDSYGTISPDRTGSSSAWPVESSGDIDGRDIFSIDHSYGNYLSGQRFSNTSISDRSIWFCSFYKSELLCLSFLLYIALRAQVGMNLRIIPVHLVRSLVFVMVITFPTDVLSGYIFV